MAIDELTPPFWLTRKSAAFPFATVPVGPPGTVTVSALGNYLLEVQP